MSALPVSFLVLAWYKRLLLRGMLAPGGGPGGSPAATDKAEPEPAAAPRSATALRTRLVVLYCLATLAWTSVATPLFFQTEAIPLTRMRGFAVEKPVCVSVYR